MKGEAHMSIFSLNVDPFALIIIELPTLIFIVSIFLQIAIKKKLISISIIFLGLLVCNIYHIQFIILNMVFCLYNNLVNGNIDRGSND